MARELRAALNVAKARGAVQGSKDLSQAIELGALKGCIEILLEDLDAGVEEPKLRLKVEIATVQP